MRPGKCSLCGSFTIVSDHHELRRDKVNKALFPDIIDEDINLVKSVCNECHKYLKNIDEITLCERAKIPPRGKTAIAIWNRNGQRYRP